MKVGAGHKERVVNQGILRATQVEILHAVVDVVSCGGPSDGGVGNEQVRRTAHGAGIRPVNPVVDDVNASNQGAAAVDLFTAPVVDSRVEDQHVVDRIRTIHQDRLEGHVQTVAGGEFPAALKLSRVADVAAAVA